MWFEEKQIRELLITWEKCHGQLCTQLNDANQIFETLMGDLTDGRKNFIQENSLKVANLDI